MVGFLCLSFMASYFTATRMKYDKPPITFEQQLQLLIDRGLQCSDINQALHNLERVSYYRLSAYWYPVKNPDDSFKAGASFDAALQLYEFDRHLRLHVIDAIERIEIALRTAITYTLSHAYGTFAHTNPDNFRDSFRHDKWTQKVQYEAKNSQEDFIRHYRTSYDNYPTLPIWMVTEIISIGSLSRLYEGMLHKDQSAVASDYAVHPSVLRSWIRTLNYIRNICAHHGRLWNRQLAVAPDLPRHDKNWQAPLTPTNRRLFAVLLILRQMMAHHHQGAHWQSRVDELLQPIALKDYWRISMGLPDHWQTHPLWNRTVKAQTR